MLVQRKRKSVGIYVYADKIEVRAPLRMSYALIEPIVRERAGWILRKQRELQQRVAAMPPRIPHTYTDGDRFMLLGRDYHLQVLGARRDSIQIARGRLIVCSRDPNNPERTKALLERYFRAQAERIFARRMRMCWKRVAHWGKPYPLLKVRVMRARWGSCSARGSITLNRRLLQAPIPLIDYVILHEFCHLREMNHSAAYYRLLAGICPHWKTYKKRLNLVPFVD